MQGFVYYGEPSALGSARIGNSSNIDRQQQAVVKGRERKGDTAVMYAVASNVQRFVSSCPFSGRRSAAVCHLA